MTIDSSHIKFSHLWTQLPGCLISPWLPAARNSVSSLRAQAASPAWFFVNPALAALNASLYPALPNSDWLAASQTNCLSVWLGWLLSSCSYLLLIHYVGESYIAFGKPVHSPGFARNSPLRLPNLRLPNPRTESLNPGSGFGYPCGDPL